jgi:hypothetical protein
MALGFGYNAWLGFGTESTYGTPVTRTAFLEINSESLVAEDDVVDGNSTFSLTKDKDNFTQGRKKVGGNVEFDVRQQGAETLFKHALGSHGYTAIGTGTASGTEHTFGIADALPTGLTMEVNRDVCSFVYHGCKINELTLNGDNEGILKASASIIAEDEGTSAASTPSFSTSSYYKFSQCVLNVAGGTRNARTFNITLNNNLTDDRYHLGARTIKEPQRAGRVEVSGEIEMEFDGTTDWSMFNTAGTAAFSATYTGDTLNGTVANKLQVNCPYIRFTKATPTVSDSGMIMLTVPFQGYSDGSTTALRPLNVVIRSLTNGTDV